MPQCPFLVALASQESLVSESFQELTDVESLSPVNVSAPFCIWDKIVASLCYSDKYSYSHLTIYIPTEACNYLAEERG